MDTLNERNAIQSALQHHAENTFGVVEYIRPLTSRSRDRWNVTFTPTGKAEPVTHPVTEANANMRALAGNVGWGQAYKNEVTLVYSPEDPSKFFISEYPPSARIEQYQPSRIGMLFSSLWFGTTIPLILIYLCLKLWQIYLGGT